MVERIASILKNKGSVIHSVSPDATAHEAVAMMATNGIGAVLVIEQGSLLGIVSAKDYGTRVVAQGKNGKDVRVREIMTSPLVAVGPDVKIMDGMQIMTTKKIRHLPILKDGELVGVVTLADLVRAVLADQEHKIDQLMRYVGHK
ncbi:MAG: CBS domain-containing protein [Acidobacteria bacterium]|nr:CBS domain-containing protein [Acidobacteriota bacterium]